MINPRIQVTSDEMDSDDVYFEEGGEEIYGFAYRSKADGTFHIMKCPSCKKENYAMQVAEGSCAWCGYRVEK